MDSIYVVGHRNPDTDSNAALLLKMKDWFALMNR